MKSSEWKKANTMQAHPHDIDEKDPEIFLNVDLVRKTEEKDHEAHKDCKNCCDWCKEKAKKGEKEQILPSDK